MRARSIINDAPHPNHGLFTLLPSGSHLTKTCAPAPAGLWRASLLILAQHEPLTYYYLLLLVDIQPSVHTVYTVHTTLIYTLPFPALSTSPPCITYLIYYIFIYICIIIWIYLAHHHILMHKMFQNSTKWTGLEHRTQAFSSWCLFFIILKSYSVQPGLPSLTSHFLLAHQRPHENW